MPISDRIIPSSQMLITHDMPWCKTTINQPSPDAGQVIRSKNLGGSQSQIMVYIFIPIEQVTKIMQGKEAKIQYNKK